MSSEYKDLPAAFPSHFKNTQKVETDYFGHSIYPGETVYNTGMSLRDYFAAKAMQSFITGYLSNGSRDEPFALENGDGFHAAKIAYKMADEMLKARGE